MKCWHVTMWSELYESAQSRGVQTLSFYAKPNKLVGEGLGFTLAQEDGLALLGTWALIEALASHGLPKQRGWLFRNGSPLDAPRMAALLRIPLTPIERALKHFSTAPMDWLEEAEFPFASARSQSADGRLSARSQSADGRLSARSQSADGISARLRTERERTEEIERERRKGEGLSAEELRARQIAQFAAATARIKALESVPEEDLTEKNRAELKEMKALAKKIQKKQARGDFSPVEEEGRK